MTGSWMVLGLLAAAIAPISGCGDDAAASAPDGAIDGGPAGPDGAMDGSPAGPDGAIDGGAIAPAPLAERGTWTNVSSDGAPSPRVGHTIVWTGTEYIVWGGTSAGPDVGAGELGDGARYDPATDRWRPVSTVGAPGPRSAHKAVWTGERMAVFGRDVDVFPTQPMEGWLYDPAADSWTAMTTVGAPAPRAYYDVVAVDGKVVVWGGYSAAGVGTEEFPAATGGVYDPATDAWTPIAEAAAPQYGGGHTLLAQAGGFVSYGATTHFLAPGAGTVVAARYLLATQTWTEIGSTMGLIGNGQAYNASAIVEGRLVSVSATPDSRQCLFLALDPDGTFSREVLSVTTGAAAPSCLYVVRQEPLLVAGHLVAAEPRLLLELASHELFTMPLPPYDALASEPLPAGFVVDSWDGSSAATDGSRVFVFGGVIRATQPPPMCPPGAPCLPPGEASRGARGALFTP